jgi:atypical dual specificity phosphatase
MQPHALQAPPAARFDGPPPILALRGFGVAFGSRLVLSEVDLSVPTTGIVALMGSAGGGKSTLLRCLAGVNHAQPDLRQWGEGRYCDRPLGEGKRPVLVQQDAQYFTSTVRENLVSSFADRSQLDRAAQAHRVEQLLASARCEDLRQHLDQEALGLATAQRRLLSVLRAAATDAPLICVDEPTAGLDDEASQRILTALRWYADRHAVLFVTHHQGHARAIAHRVVLLGGGRVQEATTTAQFFGGVPSPVVEHFLESGSLSLPSPNADPEQLADTVPPPPPLSPTVQATLSLPAAFVGPRDFRWLIPGRLGGLPRPGIVAAVADDVAGLGRLGITTLITLEETETVPTEALRSAGITNLHFPILDMDAPTVPEAARWCREIEARLAAGQVVAVHCRAGQGRTGTVLACQAIWQGATAIEALDLVRGINPRWVTSDVQVRFLSSFAEQVGPERPSPSGTRE